MTSTVAVFAIGGTATLAIVEDMQVPVSENEAQRAEAEQKRREAKQA